MIEFIKVFLWRVINFPKIRFNFIRTKALRNKLQILNSSETVSIIVKNKLSVSRFGDGEFQMIDHFLASGDESNFPVDSFQVFNHFLAERLYEILFSTSSNHLICIPYAFKDSSVSKFGARIFWEREWNARSHLFSDLDKSNVFGDTNFTRFYMDRKDIDDYAKYIHSLKQIWEFQDVLIVEGEMSRLGIGNDLFDNVNSIQRILCPIKDAFTSYNEIMNECVKYAHNKLVLIALGHSATLLAYDLAKLGHWAIDIGHVDIEYEWYKMKAKKKVSVPNKYVNEVQDGRLSVTIGELVYKEQILAIIRN